MSTGKDGIQMLLQAEKEAAEMVNEAKRRKARRLKEAKEEAVAEIEAEKSERERIYKLQEEKVMGRRSDIEQQINRATDAGIKKQSEIVNVHKDEAINLLLDMVFDIKPSLHKNFRGSAVAAS